MDDSNHRDVDLIVGYHILETAPHGTADPDSHGW